MRTALMVAFYAVILSIQVLPEENPAQAQEKARLAENPPAERKFTITSKNAASGSSTGSEVVIGQLRMTCDMLKVQGSINGVDGLKLQGEGNVRVYGVPDHVGAITANRFSWSSSTGVWTFAGDIILPTTRGLVRFEACTVAADGSHRDTSTLLERFARASEVERSALVPRILREYPDKDVPDEVKLRAAQELLRKHLTWHAPHQPPDHHEYKRVGEFNVYDHGGGSRWEESLGGPEWMQGDIPNEVREPFIALMTQDTRHEKELIVKALARTDLTPEVRKFFANELERINKAQKVKLAQYWQLFSWRLKDAGHADVSRAVKLLSAIQGPLAPTARRWATEISRNNTVLTLDVTGAYERNQDAPVVLDVRNADAVSVKLYRVKKPTDLLWVTDRIGTDFVYHDHGLQFDIAQLVFSLKAQAACDVSILLVKQKVEPPPEFLKDKPIANWNEHLANLKHTRDMRDFHCDDDDQDAEGRHFDDACSLFRQRINKEYQQRHGYVSTWRCNRIMKVPGKHLAEAGAYVVAVEAHGQVVYAPLIVDPLTLGMRRCRDGVMTVVSDGTGQKPCPGAEVIARDLQGTPPKTDAAGVAWASVFAAGDRAIVAHKDGRFAIGGFGRVFDGIYFSPYENEYRLWQRNGLRLVEKAGNLKEALVFADRSVIAAYSDRPTYRPGQLVQFKVITRQLALADPAKVVQQTGFRDDVFNADMKLEQYPVGTLVPYTLRSPDGKVVANGTLKLNEFGTAADQAALAAEAAIGNYSLSLTFGNQVHTLSDVFAVRHYRLPNFQVEVAGIPEKLPAPADLKLRISGKTNIGKPVIGGTFAVRLVSRETRKIISNVEGTLNDDGSREIDLTMPSATLLGDYEVAIELRDASGRTLTRTYPLVIGKPAARPAAAGMLAAPRFHPLAKPLVIRTAAAKLTAAQWLDGKATPALTVNSVDGQASLQFKRPGWYAISDGKNTSEVFVYGGKQSPFSTSAKPEERNPKDEAGRPDPLRMGQWVNLSNYAQEEHDEYDTMSFKTPVLALFDQHKAEVGGTLSVLVFVPSPGARVLFTSEGRTVVDYFFASMPADSHYMVVDIPIRARHMPNFYLQAQAAFSSQNRDTLEFQRFSELSKRVEEEAESLEGENPRWCRIDVIDSKLVAGSEKLRITMTTEREDYKPGEQVKVRLRVTDRDGKPAAAEASLGVVDESVYTFGNDRVRTLADTFSRPIAERQFLDKTWRTSTPLAVRKSRERRLERALDQAKAQAVMELQKGEQALNAAAQVELPRLETQQVDRERSREQLPIGSIPLARLRADFRETAAWFPQLRTDSTGIAEASFRLPDTLTSYRLTAVALTQEAALGTNTSRIRAVLPLSAQVILPRFAVETDRFDGVGLIHNHQGQDHVVAYRWEIEGARADAKELTGTVAVAAGKSARVALPLLMDRIGPVLVKLHVSAGTHADAESRSLVVQSVGRHHEVHYDGTFTKQAAINLPASFIPGDITVVVAPSDLARALEGLGGLVDYPYGCVEQTMSRFLPAVVVKRAAKDLPIGLPPAVAAKLPDVLSKGLNRLYSFQHADGGWGWWEQDATDTRMTIYVVHGLLQCRAAGIEVRKDVLDRGAAFLQSQLSAGKVPEDLVARGWQALALWEQVSKDGLTQAAKNLQGDRGSMEDRCRLALACRAAGIKDQAANLWKLCEKWQPTTAESLALLLMARVEFAEEATGTRDIASRLMKLRIGLCWENTPTTAAAILALVKFLPHLPRTETHPKNLRILIDDQVVGKIDEQDARKEVVYRFHFSGKQLTRKMGQRIRIEAEGNSILSYTIESVGVTRLEKLEPSGTAIRMTRRMETLDGKPCTGPIKVGQVVQVRLKIESDARQDYVLIEDRRPGNCEFAEERIEKSPLMPAPGNTEFRDDRVCVFLSSLPAGKHELVYYLRGETPGNSCQLPGCIFPMYQDTIRGETAANQVHVRDESIRMR